MPVEVSLCVETGVFHTLLHPRRDHRRQQIKPTRTMDIYQAASQGNTDALRAAVEQGCNVNAPDQAGKTPLWLAVQSGQEDACGFLISQGADLKAQGRSILDVAVQEGYTEIVALLWPHCSAGKEYHSLESAISLGFHEIADFLIETGEFGHQYSQTTGAELSVADGFPERDIAAFQQWERFFFVRRGQQLQLGPVFLGYALLLAAKADRNGGLRLMQFLLEETAGDPNCKIKINVQFETPLTAAAEKGNLEILAALIDHPNTSLTLAGKYGWPAFLHLLANPHSISTERGRNVARRLSYEASPNQFFNGESGSRLEMAFENVLRFGNTRLVRQVIDLVRGAAGTLILPLLIRANEADGLKWIFNSDTVFLSNPPPALWVVLCQYFDRHEDPDALELFAGVAELLVEKKTWNPSILKCLYTRNFSFMQQFFYPRCHVPPKEVTESTLVGLPAASTDESLMKEWADAGFACETLWNAIHCGIWTSPAFDHLLLSPSVDLNEPDPYFTSRRPELEQIPHAFFKDLSSEGQKDPFRPSPRSSASLSPQQAQVRTDYQMQMMLLEQENKRRLMLSRDQKALSPQQAQILTGYQMQSMLLEQQNKKRLILSRDQKGLLSFAITTRNALLLDTLLLCPRVNINSQDHYGRTPMMYAIAVNHRPILERLLSHGGIDLNLRDAEGRTAIFYAAQGGKPDIVQLLVGTHKVDFSIQNKQGQTVRDFARAKKMKEIVTALST